MLKLAGITIFTILLMSLIFGADPVTVMVNLIKMPVFQGFFLTSVLIVFIYSSIEKKKSAKS